MSEIRISPESQAALVKLLIKLKLLAPDILAHSPLPECECPISFYARKGQFDEWAAIEKVATCLNIPVLQVERANTEKLMLLMDDPLVRRVGMETWRGLRAVPFEITESDVTLGMANPLEMSAVRELEFTLGLKVRIGIAQEAQILQIISKQLNLSEVFSLEHILNQVETDLARVRVEDAPKQEQGLFADDLDSAPVIRLVNKILWESVEKGASDIHITPEQDRVLVRIRVDGIMRELLTIPSNLNKPVISRLKLLSGMDIAEKRKPQDGRMRIKTPLSTKDLRVSTVPTMYGENLVARILSSELRRLEFENLGMNQRVEKALREALNSTSRVVLVTGPTGSGKTSTLYAGLLTLNDGTRNIITIEDPIEYKISGITQIQVNHKVGITFADGLRSILRQDPDVVMLGEIRDLETAEVAMQAAQTGHLVLSTVHTNTAAGAVTRLRDLGLKSFLMASSLGALVAQRLVRALCTHCAVPACEEVMMRCRELGVPTEHILQAKGCRECSDTGYMGRTGVYSYLDISDDVREAIRTEQSERELERLARNSLFLSLEEAALEHVASGLTSLEEVERVIGPIHASTTRHMASGAKSSTTDENGSVHGRRKLLIVDDSEDFSGILQLILQNEFFDVATAKDGIEGLERIYEWKPDIVICDQMMPRMSGYQLLQKLRADSRIRKTPVLMLTAADSEESELQLIAGGADDFVSKSSDKKVLVARINRLMQRSGV